MFTQVLLRDLEPGLAFPLEAVVSGHAHEPLQVEQEFPLVVRLK